MNIILVKEKQRNDEKLSTITFNINNNSIIIYFNFDYFASIIPGWNTTINSGWKITFIILIMAFVFSLLIMILINVISKILKMLIYKKSNNTSNTH